MISDIDNIISHIRNTDLPPGQSACIEACKDWKKLKKRNKADLAAKYGGSRSSWKKRM